MNEIEIVRAGFKELFKRSEFQIIPLPQSGSDRKYFRITSDSRNVIGVHNANLEENEAFVGFTKHFISKGLPVPEIFEYLPERFIYFLQDLGDTNLFTWLRENDDDPDFEINSELLYRKILDNLIQFQVKGIDGLNLDLCYPHRSFDRQSMMWDMNYFKYMFLKLIAVPFNERRLENDFEQLADFLLKAGQNYFLYRDFQSANIMIVNGIPWFIDYQGGRKGAPQYDVASLLYDAKVHIPQNIRENLLNYYVKNFCLVSGEDQTQFEGYYTGFCIIRLMQALGAFGFRGLYEKKPTFTDSIVPAIKLLNRIIDSEKLPVNLPELLNTLRLIPGLSIYSKLSVTTNSKI